LKPLLTLAIIFALSAGIWQVKSLIEEVNHTAKEAAQTALEAKALTARVHRLSAGNRGLVTSLQSAIVESCRVNGNARAKVTREQLHEEIREAEHPDPQAFDALVQAGIPPETIRELTAKTAAKLRGRLDRVKLTPCASQYRISPGSGARRRAKP
jgi:hypothetical protein